MFIKIYFIKNKVIVMVTLSARLQISLSFTESRFEEQ